MTTIKNLRDEDGFFYPRTHVKAVLNDDGTNVQNLINSVDEDINQAQIKADVIKSTGDGSLYLSNDGTYKELPPIDTDEHLYITVTSNQPQPDTSLYGTKIVVTDTTDGTSETFTWNGTKIHKKIPYSHVYTIVTTPVEGYSTPDVKTFTAELQGSNDVEIISNACVLSFTSPVFAEVTISYDNVTRLTNSSNIIKVPYGKTVTVIPHAVEGYITPSVSTVVANADSKTVTLNYIQSQLKINILSNQGEDETIDAVEATVTYGSTSVKVINGQTIAVPSDTTIGISFPEVEGYLKPEDITFNHTNGISEKTGTYYTELLTVNVTSDDGNISGFEVTISKKETVGIATKYTKLEYVEADGTQWIDTGFIPNQDTNIYMDAIPTEVGNHNVSGFFFGSSTPDFLHGIEVYVHSDVFTSCWGGQYVIATNNVSANKRYNISVEKNVVNITENGNSVYSNTYNYTSFISATTLQLCRLMRSGTEYRGALKIYSCKIYDNGVLVRDYIPVLRNDGVSGLYDSVNDLFYASNGTENFIAGASTGEVIAVQTSVTGTYKISHGVDYVIEANDVLNYITPQSYSKRADAQTNTVYIEYGYDPDPGVTSPTNGIWIQSTDGKFYTDNNWMSSKTPNGIAVIGSRYSFIMALENAYTSPCGWGGFGTTVSGITTTTDIDWAMGDYDGEAQTTTIINALKGKSDGHDTGAPAAEYCRKYIFPNGKTGYLGAAGEWQAIADNISKVKSALQKCIGTNNLNYYWTSTQYDANYCWYLDGDELSYWRKPTGVYVRAFASI